MAYEVGQPFSYFSACCLPESCSNDSFKRAEVWGYTEEEARSQMHKHLARSSLHSSDFGEMYTAFDAASNCEGLVEDKMTEEQVKEWCEQNGPSKQKGQSHGVRGGVSNNQVQQVSQMFSQAKSILKEAKEHTAVPMPIGAEPTLRMLTPRPPSELPLTLSTRRSTPSSSSGSGIVRIRETELQVCLDTVKRAATAAKHAQKLSASAAQAFANEAMALDSCTEVLEATLTASLNFAS